MMNRVLDTLPLVAAVAIVGVGLYVLLDKGAAIVETRPEPAIQGVAPAPPNPTYQPSYQPAPVPQERPSGPAIYRCKQDGAVVYSDSPCKGGRVVDVQVTEGFEGQRFQQQRRTRPVVENAPAASAAPFASESLGSTNAAVCEQIIQAIANIDSAARAGGTIQHMEYLKEERRKLVAKRQELRC